MTEATGAVIRHVRQELGKVIVGQQELIDQTVATILCNGHALIEGVPGLAKTLTVKCVAAVLSAEFRRVQCTSDLMPADIIGTNIFDAATGSFRLHRGPVFADLLLVDEINRMPPRTQAALLETMEERQASIDGRSYPMSTTFTVFATQNPVEFEGTYPLPEAQLDRFLLKILVSYPDLSSEIGILNHQNLRADDPVSCSTGTDSALSVFSPIDGETLLEARRQVMQIRVEQTLIEYIARIVRKTREWASISLGASPRAGLSVLKVAKALAAMDERDFVIPDDVKKAVPGTLRHRLILRPEAELEGVTAEEAVQQVVRSIEVPR